VRLITGGTPPFSRGGLLHTAREGTVKGRIRFKYDPHDDVVVATPEWSIETEQDCEVWRQQWVDFLEPYGRKMDCVMVLDHFHVAAGIAAAWGKHRAEINKKYIRYSFRVNSEMQVRTFALTSGIRYDAASAEAVSVEAAIEGIRDARRKAGV
jgi:hypothetical protein